MVFMAGDIRDQRADQLKLAGKGKRIPGWLIEKMKKEAEIVKRIQLLSEELVAKKVKVGLPVGEYVWHQERLGK